MKLTEVATQRFIDNITSITPGALKGGLLMVSRRPQKKIQVPLSGVGASTAGLVGSPLGQGPFAVAALSITSTMRRRAKVPIDTPGAVAKLYDELLIGGSDGVPRLYKMHRENKRVIGDDANKVREYEAMPGRIYAGCFNADGSLLAVGSSLDGRGEVRIYQANDGKRVALLEGQRGAVYAVKFHPDGNQVASAGFDGVVRLHDAQTGKLIREFLPVPATASKVAATSGR
jgi:WD40 repeat protein